MLWAGRNITRKLDRANRMAGKIKDCLQRAKEGWAGWELILKVVLPSAFFIFLALLYTLIFVSSDCCNEGVGVNWVCGTFGVNQKDNVIRMLGWGLAGAIAICALVIANRRAKGTIKAAEAQAKAAEAQADAVKTQADAVKVTETGNRQERFRDGVSHLGHDKESVRQGGAHALFHLALDDKELRASIADILCAHIRAITRPDEYQESYKDKPSTEILSLLSLLFTTKTRSAETLDAFWEGLTPDLSGGYFRGAELLRARFHGAQLEGAQFQGAKLEGAQFQGAWLFETQFQGAWLFATQFQGAWLGGAQFQGAWLGGPSSRGRSLKGPSSRGRSLKGPSSRERGLEGPSSRGRGLAGLNSRERILTKLIFPVLSASMPKITKTLRTRLGEEWASCQIFATFASRAA